MAYLLLFKLITQSNFHLGLASYRDVQALSLAHYYQQGMTCK
ncbi:hypothetical protein GMES_2523 [Paraglaciecola mesophila KMM 241]|uniref:Uncharacterized protein n=1 Tax=Paraglaciecola mesophila KMM 241 TaxID=1128912 RepID=K6Z780_9ALTE|nr:hypothetical protein GMES_2523 [Paraglaciecola mesophila KMM 241]